MSNDIVVVLALLKHLGMLTAKEAKLLYDDLKFKNLSTSLEDSLKMVEELFAKHSVGIKKTTTTISVDGKDVKITK